MIFDFRVIRTKIKERDVYQIHRVSYKDENKLIPLYIESVPASIIGYNPKEMLLDIEMMTNAFDSPTIYIPEWNMK